MSAGVTPLVQARGLEKRYVDGPAVVEVLRGLDLDIAAGERVAIIGESGVGKSTLLHLLGCLDAPTGGQLAARRRRRVRALRGASSRRSATARWASSSSSTISSATSPPSRTSCCRR